MRFERSDDQYASSRSHGGGRYTLATSRRVRFFKGDTSAGMFQHGELIGEADHGHDGWDDAVQVDFVPGNPEATCYLDTRFQTIQVDLEDGGMITYHDCVMVWGQRAAPGRPQRATARFIYKSRLRLLPCVRCGGGGFSGHGSGYGDVCDECGGQGCYPVSGDVFPVTGPA